jgi:integrase
LPSCVWNAPIDSITAPALLDVMLAIQRKVPETATRIRQRLEAVFNDAQLRGQCLGNPAFTIRKPMTEALGKRQQQSLAALPYPELPVFVVALRKQNGVAARALEFALLTASRTGEVIGARWDELDADASLWVIPASRMKGGEPHTVYLSPRATEIVTAARDYGGEPYVFPSPTDKAAPLSNMAMLTLLRRMDADKRTTVHGLCRASFSTWANETAAARPDVIEACLAHRESDRVKAAYNRAKFAVERKALLAAWADYCDSKQPAATTAPRLALAA